MDNNKIYEITAKLMFDESYTLRLELKNMSNEALYFNEGFLKRDDIRLVVTKDLAFGGVLDEIAVIDDPYPRQIKVEAGASYSQEIDLVKIYPKFLSELGRKNLILFWSVRAEPVGKSNISEQFGGFIFINK